MLKYCIFTIGTKSMKTEENLLHANKVCKKNINLLIFLEKKIASKMSKTNVYKNSLHVTQEIDSDHSVINRLNYF